MSLRLDGRVLLLSGAAEELPSIGQLLADLGAGIVPAAGDSGPAVDAAVHVLPRFPAAGTGTDFDAIEQATEALQDLFEAVHPAWSQMSERGAGRLVLVWPAAPGEDPLERLSSGPDAVVGMGASGLAGVLKLEGGSDLRTNVVLPLLGDDSSAPAALAPLVAFLAHPACDLNGAVLAVGPSGIRRVLIGVTPGEFNAAISTSWVAERAPALAGAEDFVVPAQGRGEMPLLLRHFG